MKQDNLLSSVFTTISSLCEEHDLRWQKRRRLLSTLLVFQYLVELISSRGLREAAMVCSLEKKFPTIAGVIHARKKIGWGIYRRILKSLYKQVSSKISRHYLWRGRRVFAIDGTKLNLPRCFAAKGYRLSPNAYYPQAMLSILYDVMVRLPVSAEFNRHEDERRAAPHLLKALSPSDVVIYDRGYFSLALALKHKEEQLDAVFRLRKRSLRELEPLWQEKAPKDEIVRIVRKGVDLKLRIIRYRIKDSLILLATTLLDKEAFPFDAIRKLYHKRWATEEGLKTFKQMMCTETWHSKSSTGVKQEIFVNLIGLFLSRLMELSKPKLKPNSQKVGRRDSNHRKRSERVCCQVIRIMTSQMDPRRPFDIFNWKHLTQITDRYSTESKPRRSFPRISRKPIGKWRMGGKVRQRQKQQGLQA